MAELKETLEALNRCDRESEELARDQVQIPEAIAACEARVQAAREALEAERCALEEAEKRRREKEAELRDCEARREKYQGQTALVKTNTEYTALLNEIDGMTRRISQVEEEILGAMEAIDAIAVRVKSLEAEKRREEEAYERDVRQLRERQVAVERDLGAHEKLRADLLASLSSRVNSQYQRVRKSRGSGTSQIQGRACGSCHRDIPYEMINRLLASELQTCPNCGRILVAPDE